MHGDLINCPGLVADIQRESHLLLHNRADKSRVTFRKRVIQCFYVVEIFISNFCCGLSSPRNACIFFSTSLSNENYLSLKKTFYKSEDQFFIWTTNFTIRLFSLARSNAMSAVVPNYAASESRSEVNQWSGCGAAPRTNAPRHFIEFHGLSSPLSLHRNLDSNER